LKKHAVRWFVQSIRQWFLHIGKRIVNEEQLGNERAEYGKYLLKNLAKNLTPEFGKGFDERELRRMRQFFLTFPIRDALRPELSWTHYRLLLRVEKEEIRNYYMKESVELAWSARQLERQINSFYYERLLASQNKELVKQEIFQSKDLPSAGELIKNPYILEFLDLKENKDYLEVDLETSLLNKLQEFLLELGKGFSFVARQQRLTTDAGKHYYIDLVFYNYLLKCFILIDLKTGTLTPQDVGQMDLYVRMYDKQHRVPNDNPTIGIILCSETDHTVVEYSVLADKDQLFASQYKLYLPTEEELNKLLNSEY
jgi:predicted nuclease of restriction endonuclease-like (RecB) superfamily